VAVPSDDVLCVQTLCDGFIRVDHGQIGERATEAALIGNLCLSCFSLDCVVNLFSRLVVNLHVVLLTTMLLDFRHDLSFAVCGDLPIAVFRANVRAAKTQFLITLRFALSDCHVYPPAAMLLPIS
jgi:hypothetical protein